MKEELSYDNSSSMLAIAVNRRRMKKTTPCKGHNDRVINTMRDHQNETSWLENRRRRRRPLSRVVVGGIMMMMTLVTQEPVFFFLPCHAQSVDVSLVINNANPSQSEQAFQNALPPSMNQIESYSSVLGSGQTAAHKKHYTGGIKLCQDHDYAIARVLN